MRLSQLKDEILKKFPGFDSIKLRFTSLMKIYFDNQVKIIVVDTTTFIKLTSKPIYIPEETVRKSIMNYIESYYHLSNEKAPKEAMMLSRLKEWVLHSFKSFNELRFGYRKIIFIRSFDNVRLIQENSDTFVQIIKVA